MDINIKPPEGARIIIERLSKEGFRGDIVGGCVRDHLLLKQPHDYDITTSATPDEMLRVFRDMRTIETGLKHGTLTVMYEGEPFEVTTYRLDGEYTDNRHPDSVSFTRELSLDLSRRDFTINAMCYNPDFGVTDLFGGRADIDARVIRAVGDPERRFSEDALRILRALRFAATLDFEIEEATSLAIYKTAHLMKNVSRERITVEFTKLLAGVGAYRIITEYFDILKSVIPNITLENISGEEAFLAETPTVRELSLFNTPTEYDEAMRELKSDNRRREYGALVLSLKDRPSLSADDIKLLLIEGGPDAVRDHLALLRLAGKVDSLNVLGEVLAADPCYKISQLNIRGDHLAALGISGKAIGDMLSLILREVALGRVENELSALTAFALSKIN